MATTLLDLARSHSETHANEHGVAQTPIPGLTIVRETRPGTLQYAVNHPLVALVLQGRKTVLIGQRSLDLGAGESLLITMDVPTLSEITVASIAKPYVSIVFDLDISIIENLVVEIGSAPFATGDAVRVHTTEEEAGDSAVRLLRLLDRPGSATILQAQLIRELHFWLLSGRHGGAIRALGIADSHSKRISRAVSLLRANFTRPLRVEQLAETAGMSLSTLHEHFRAITSLTPIQFQKQMRLIEARRLMMSEGVTITHASHAVGYESVPQFTREYGRMFGLSPARDMRAMQVRASSAA
jgi:AraC-like DNA-binding protein